MDIGIKSSIGKPIANPLPKSWLGLSSAPPGTPSWATVGPLSSTQTTNLQAQIAYDLSKWDYTKIGNNNQLGRYQFNSLLLESYGLIAAGSNKAYGSNCINYQYCWRPVYLSNEVYQYENYFYNTTSLDSFLSNNIAQEHLAYQRLVDLYVGLSAIDAILPSDATDIVAGMIYVAWILGVGSTPDKINPTGTGAYSWRYYGTNDAGAIFNSGRYAITVLGQ